MADIIDFKKRKIKEEEEEQFEPALDWENWIDDKVLNHEDALVDLRDKYTDLLSHQHKVLHNMIDLAAEVDELRSVLNSLIRGLKNQPKN